MALNLNVHKVHGDVMLMYGAELRDRFEYSLDAVVHFEAVDAQRIAFTLQTQVRIMDITQLSVVQVVIACSSHADAVEMERVVEMEMLLFILQETLRDSHFAGAVLESIDDVRITSISPQTSAPSPAPSMTPSVISSQQLEEDDAAHGAEGSDESIVSLLFTSASAADWLSLIGVVVLSMAVCAGCIVGIGLLCVHRQKQQTRGEIRKYRQAQDESETDMEELQDMMHEEHSVEVVDGR